MRKITLLGLLLTATVALGCGAGSGDENAASSNDDKKSEAKTAKIGEAARDGKFEFTVQKVKCGVNKVGTDLLGEKAQGQFCLVTLKVANIGKKAQAFSDSNQKAYAPDGTEYSSDSAAALYANKDAATLFNEINPGNNITGVLVFDIPKDAKLAKIKLHDSAFSGGISVQLS